MAGIRSFIILGFIVVVLLPGCRSDTPGPPEPTAETVATSADPLNVVLVVIDTLRADRMSLHGNERETTPRIDAFARTAVTYSRAYSQAPWTTPSIASLLTSMYPSELGIRNEKSVVPAGAPLLQAVLQEHGFATGGVVSHSFCSKKWGFGRGFDSFDESNILGHEGISSAGVTDRGIEFLDQVEERPFFLFAHYFDPHFVYLEHDEHAFGGAEEDYQGPVHSGVPIRELNAMNDRITDQDVDELLRHYDSELAFTDHHVGRLLEHLTRLGIQDRTLVVITGDHGEEFFDHGRVGHARTLYNELLRVPLVVYVPDSDPGVVESAVRLIDVYPTILDRLGIQLPESARGSSLPLPGRSGDDARPVFAETVRRSTLRSITIGRYKLIRDLGRETAMLFDVEQDFGETRDLASEDPARVRLLESALESWARSVERGTEGDSLELSPQDKERLEALGYF